MSFNFLKILESVINENNVDLESLYDKFVVVAYDGSHEYFMDKDGKFDFNVFEDFLAKDIDTPEHEIYEYQMQRAKMFDTIEEASEFFKKKFPKYTNYKIYNDEHHAAKIRHFGASVDISILPLDHYLHLLKEKPRKKTTENPYD